jgi:hypothetical protein
VPTDFEEMQLTQLQWGLEQLETGAVSAELPSGWNAWCGVDDPLLDSVVLAERISGLKLVVRASHHPAALLQAWAEAVR